MEELKSDEHYKKLLEKRKREIDETLESYKESSKPVDLGASFGRLSRMDALQHQQMVLNAKKQAEITRDQINQAFKRLEQGSYGECLICEEEISPKRLEARPETPFCLNCQNKKS